MVRHQFSTIPISDIQYKTFNTVDLFFDCSNALLDIYSQTSHESCHNTINDL